MRTFDRETYFASREAWAEGDFSAEWKDVRHQAAMRGIIFPPNGTQWDSWEDDNPTQRAILIRAIRETPELLRKCIDKGKSWDEIIGILLNGRDDMREELQHRDLENEAELQDRPSHRESAMALGRIIERIATSVGVEAGGPEPGAVA